MEPSKYRFLLWQFIMAIDTGKYDSLSFREVHSHAEAGTLDTFLKEHLGADLDLSMIEPKDWVYLRDEWERFANAADFGLRNKGTCLLLAYALEGLQSSGKK